MTRREIVDALVYECEKHKPECSSGDYECPLIKWDCCIWNVDEREFTNGELTEMYNECYPDTPTECIDEPEEVIEDAANTTEEVDDPINPNHYTKHGMECIDEMLLVFGKDAVKWFCLCNAWKYRKRAMWKNGAEDIEKSDWYIAKYQELQELEGA